MAFFVMDTTTNKIENYTTSRDVTDGWVPRGVAPVSLRGSGAVALSLLLAVGGGERDIGQAYAQQDSIVTRGIERREAASTSPATRRSSSTVFEDERRPVMYCGTPSLEASQSIALCTEDFERSPIVRQCEDGSVPLAPLFRRTLDAATGEVIEEWRQVDNGGCPEDPAPEVVLNAEEFRRLPLVPAEPVIQPADGRALINLGVAVHTDDSPQELTTTVLGVPVRVRATPVQYTWDFGDGTPVVVTTSAGDEYPHQATIGEYPEPGTYELRLMTAWRGEFQIDGGGPWLPVTGTATTRSAPVIITVETAPTRLYDDP